MKVFLKKEWMEFNRTGRLFILLLVFALFGIMNPLLAKLTPWLMETISDSFAEAGIVPAAVTVDAMTSWAQFYKNIPVGLLVFILLNCGCFTTEYQKGTLIPVVTKGLSHRNILFAKSLLLFIVWTVCYWLCFLLTYGYNAYFWDNGIAGHLFAAAALVWLFGIWANALLIFFSSIAESSTQVLFGIGAVVLGAYLLSFFSKCHAFVPMKLMGSMSLLQKADNPADFFGSIVAAGICVLLCMVSATICFDRKQL